MGVLIIHPHEFAVLLRNAIDRNEDARASDIALTLVARSAKGLGVRPKILAHNENGEKVYGLTKKQCNYLLRKLESIEHNDY